MKGYLFLIFSIFTTTFLRFETVRAEYRTIIETWIWMKRQLKPIIDYTTWTQEQFEEEMETNPKCQKYFEGYEETSVKNFIKHHAAAKVAAFSRYTKIRAEYEAHQMLFLTLADEIIDAILQKKLFNLQCLWRAGKADLPFVKVTTDFKYFEKHIRACPFIEPVTEEEIDLALRFLREYRWTEFDKDGDWQDYDDFKDFLSGQGSRYATYPALYAFLDQYQETGFLIKMRDIRSEKEDHYIRTYRNAREEEARKLREANGEPEPAGYYVRTLPYLHYASENRAHFTALCESKQIQEAIRLHEYRDEYLNNTLVIYDALALMARMKDKVPVRAHADWKTALLESARVYKQDQMRAHLPDAYEIYMMAFEGENPQEIIEKRITAYDPTHLVETDVFHKRKVEHLIKGRILVGEPADINYLAI